MTTWDEVRGLVRACLEAARHHRPGKPAHLKLKQAKPLTLTKPSLLVLPRVELDLSHPEERLIVYGTLAPGGKYHHLLTDIGAAWEPGTIRGILGSYQGYPSFKWNPAGEPHPAWLVTSPWLPAKLRELDDFEGEAYSRRLIPAEVGNRLVIANIYEGKVVA